MNWRSELIFSHLKVVIQYLYHVCRRFILFHMKGELKEKEGTEGTE